MTPIATRARRMLVLAALAPIVSAQEYVSRTLGVADGLANERVTCAIQDRKGYLWFGTWEGVSRFDGAEFTTLAGPEGLDYELVDSLAEDAQGRVWIATHGGGLARFLDDPRDRARHGGRRVATWRVDEPRSANVVHVIRPDDAGVLWCGTENALYRAHVDADGEPRFERVNDVGRYNWATSAVASDGALWLGESGDLVEVRAGHLARHALPDVAGLREIDALVLSAPNEIVVATELALFACTIGGHAALVFHRLAVDVGDRKIESLLAASDGTLWIGTQHGLFHRRRDGLVEQRTGDVFVLALLEDREGDVWAGTSSRGTLELSPSLVRSWTIVDGIPDANVVHVIAPRDGPVVACTATNGMFAIVDGRPHVLASSSAPFNEVGLRLTRARDDGWWIGTNSGLYRCDSSRLDLARAQAVDLLDLAPGESISDLNGADPIAPTPSVFGCIYEDAGGRVLFGGLDGNVYAVDSGPNPIARRVKLGDLPMNGPPRVMERDSSGALWLATYVGLFRIRGEHTDDFTANFSASDMQPRCFHEDARGRMWIGTRTAGAWRVDDLRAEHPAFTRFTKKDGLPSDAVWSIAEDAQHRLWFATARGLARYDPDSLGVESFTSLDGLAGDIVSQVACDARGTVWAATSGGLSAIDSNAALPARSPPSVFVVRVHASGVDVPIPETGVVNAAPIELVAGRSDVAIELSSPSFRSARHVRYEHRLAASESWSAPSSQRTIELARLAPGHYRFEARARIEGDVVSATPVLLEIDVLPPIWLRTWFLALAALAAGGIGYLVHRTRVQRMLALERIRGQIAADLHDDLGSGLSQIAILSEVARRDAPAGTRGPLEEVASLARNLRESVGEIVWAIDPKKDQVGELVRRMRQVAYNLLEIEGVHVEFRVAGDRDVEAIGLAPDQRRHLLLVLKEALANIARHAHATRAEVELRVEGRTLQLSIRDDGCGFDARTNSGGHGLSSLRRRAETLRARIEIRSEVGRGTSIELSMPVH